MLAEKKTRPTGSPPFTHAASLATTKRATTTTSTSTSSSPLAVSASFDVEEPETLADEDTARVDQRATQVRACFVGANIDIGAIEKEMPTHKKEKLADCVVITLQPPLPPGLAAAMEAAGGRGNKEGDGGAGAQTTKKAAAAAAGQVTPAHVEPPLIYRRADRLGLGKKRSPLFDASGQLSGSPLTYDVGATLYFVVYKYGSVVFFNVGRREREQCLKLARKYCPKACEGSGSTDEINVFVRPSLEDTYAFDDKVLVVKGLDINNVSVVGEVLERHAGAVAPVLLHHLYRALELQERLVLTSCNAATLEHLEARDATLSAHGRPARIRANAPENAVRQGAAVERSKDALQRRPRGTSRQRHPEFVAAECGPNAEPGIRTLYRDKETGYNVLVHVYEGGKKGPPHDHGRSWAVYGQAAEWTDMTLWKRKDDGAKVGFADLDEAETFRLSPGKAGTFEIGDIHSIHFPDGARFVRVTGTDLDAIPTNRFNLAENTVNVGGRL